MVNVTFTYPTEEDVLEMLCKMRQADKDELQIVPFSSLYDALKFSIEKADDRFTFACRVDGELVCMGGVIPEPLSGNVWFVSTDLIRKYKVQLKKQLDNGVFLDVVLKEYKMLYNYISSNNLLGLAWVKSLGFNIWDTDNSHIKYIFKRYE